MQVVGRQSECEADMIKWAYIVEEADFLLQRTQVAFELHGKMAREWAEAGQLLLKLCSEWIDH